MWLQRRAVAFLQRYIMEFTLTIDFGFGEQVKFSTDALWKAVAVAGFVERLEEFDEGDEVADEEFADEEYVYDEEGVAYWYDEENEVWYAYDEESDDWYECEEVAEDEAEEEEVAA
jgi:hypothetical protein